MGFSFSHGRSLSASWPRQQMQPWNPSVALGSVAPTTHCASLVKALTKRSKGPPGEDGREPPKTPRNYGSDPERASGEPVIPSELIPSESGLCVQFSHGAILMARLFITYVGPLGTEPLSR